MAKAKKKVKTTETLIGITLELTEDEAVHLLRLVGNHFFYQGTNHPNHRIYEAIGSAIGYDKTDGSTYVGEVCIDEAYAKRMGHLP